MHDWNVVVTVYSEEFRYVLRTLRELGSVGRSGYYNVLVMKVDNPIELLAEIEKRIEENTALYDAISHVAPALQCFEFDSAQVFIEKAKIALVAWTLKLTGRSFHVRLHLRGKKHGIGTQETERLLNDFILDATVTAGMAGKVSFTDPDIIIVIDTVDDRAGASLWTRDDLLHHCLLRPE